jgi:hypothetical protein
MAKRLHELLRDLCDDPEITGPLDYAVESIKQTLLSAYPPRRIAASSP